VNGVREIEETILGFGHINIQALHRSTIEITKENLLGKAGDCIIAISASKAACDLNSDLKRALQDNNAELLMLIEAGNVSDLVKARGSSNLVLDHPTDLVVRKSNYVCSRTLAICADKAAIDLTRKLIEELKRPKQKTKITLKVRS
jgi:hypothetical protein